MYYEGRQLKPYAESVTFEELEEGEVYYCITCLDDDMKVPAIESVIYVGTNLTDDDIDQCYFQDVDSYGQGVRYDKPIPEIGSHFHSIGKDNISFVFELDKAIMELMKCQLRIEEDRKEYGAG